MRLAIPLVGQAYKHRSLDLAAQTCRNYWPEFNAETNTIISLQPFPGLKTFASMSGADGGAHVFMGTLYKVSGTTLYSVSSDGAETAIGSITGTGLCSFDDNGIQLVIVRAGRAYSYNGSSLTVATDPDLTNPEYVTVVNNQAIYKVGDRAFGVSLPADLLNLDGLDFASKETRGDPLVRPYVFNEMLYLFGTKTTEQWYNSGVGNPPFDRIQNGLIERGTASGNSIASNSQYLYFLGDDFRVYRLIGNQIEPISTIPLSQEWQSYASISDAIGQCFAIDGQEFYYLKFPTGKTWCYSEAANGWFELTTTNTHQPYKATSIIQAYGKVLACIDGDIFELDPDTYTNNGEIILRERVSPIISAKQLGAQYEGRKLEMSKLDLVMRVTGAITGQGVSPVVMFSYSDDAGRTWSTERFLRGRRIGEYIYRIDTHQLGQFYERIIRIRVSDPIISSIQSATAEVNLGID